MFNDLEQEQNLKIKSIVFDLYYNSDYPGKCWDSGSKIAFDIGKHQMKNGCGEITCSSAFTLHTKTSVSKKKMNEKSNNNNKLYHIRCELKSKCVFFIISRCGLVIAPPEYRNRHDLTKPYPDCCVNFVKIDD